MQNEYEDIFVRYGTVDSYKEGVVLHDNVFDDTYEVLVMYHVDNHEVQDVWLGESEIVQKRDVLSFVYKPVWHGNGTMYAALQCYLEQEQPSGLSYYV